MNGWSKISNSRIPNKNPPTQLKKPNKASIEGNHIKNSAETASQNDELRFSRKNKERFLFLHTEKRYDSSELEFPAIDSEDRPDKGRKIARTHLNWKNSGGRGKGARSSTGIGCCLLFWAMRWNAAWESLSATELLWPLLHRQPTAHTKASN